MLRSQIQIPETPTAPALHINCLFAALKNNIIVKLLKKRIIAYSAIKITANALAPNSTLNPDTSSDSPSEKSKGVRFVSATQVIAQTIIKGLTKLKC